MKGKKGNSKIRSSIIFSLCVALVLLFCYIGYFGLEAFGYRFLKFSKVINRGLDLQGGISVVEEIQADKVSDADMAREIEFINMRVNKLGVAETEVKQEGEKKIRIEVPGVFDSEEVMSLIGKTGELKFLDAEGKEVLNGKDIKNAYAEYDNEMKPMIKLEMTTEGTKKFATATTANLGKVISIKMDDEVISAPTVSVPITDGIAVISGSKDLEEATTTASIIKAGALPLPVKPVSFKTVGATLGAKVIPATKWAGMIGIGLVFLFMMLLYRVPGILADIALTVFILLDLLAFALTDVTITLSGIAGFLLTVGMAVDANVLIFERIKEELNTGKSIKSSVEAGFNKALTSILDSNITTMIAGLILYLVGSGSVKGFALTLMMGIVISIFTAFFITRFLLRLSIDMGLLRKASHFGAKKKENRKFNILKTSKIWFAGAAIVIVVGIGFLSFKSLNFGIDFTGGTLIDIGMSSKITTEQTTKMKKLLDGYTKKYSLREINEGKEYELVIQTDAVDAETIGKIKNEIKTEFKLDDKSILSEDNISGSVGKELSKKAWQAIVLATVAMLIYIAIRFETDFAVAAIVALMHDVLITISLFAIFRMQVNSSFIAAMLTIVGYSINDTIVVFDRIRENKKRLGKVDLEELVDISISQSIKRSINTSLSTLLTIICLVILVPSIREFTVPLIIGITIGTGSSIFVASPIWVALKKFKQKRKLIKKNKK
ncbi:SecD/SecF fusion protein [Hathewaya proteolytica DSM 3090]|uniref:Multifunctional fusion protein n=1 Tax=Hathewaya proteolytica DSM 3090 TaxID=1121331 RepID=A0A1M6P8D8_9CLOT|nr:protein translocase subunit SecD [Hathewaya proteolytica]SHK04166.1 SecD/SecF fusion protein [Hathewaya proteolytica DSM 3090]